MRVLQPFHLTLLCIALSPILPAAADEKPAAQPALPLYHWDFSQPDFRSNSSLPAPATVSGQPQTGVPGPRPPIFPGFSPDNTALLLDGRSW